MVSITASPSLRYLPALGVAAVTGVAVGAVLLLISVLNDKPSAPIRIQQISLLPSQPPPPVEKPPEIKKEVTPIDAPKDVPMDANNPISTDNTSGNGPSIARGQGGSGIGVPFGGYSADLKADLRQWFAQEKKLRGENYEVVLKLWIAGNGRIERVELASGTGKSELDKRLRLTVAGFVGRVREPPPQEMPQPVRLGVRSLL